MYNLCLSQMGGLLMALALFCTSAPPTAAGDRVHHSFMAFGAETRLVGEDGRVEWTYPEATRDGWVLPTGRFLLVLSKSAKHRGGAVVEIDRGQKVLFAFEGTQDEVNTAQKLSDDRFMLTEAGPRPRIIEINSAGEILASIPLQCQVTNFHMQSRMTRKLPNGSYLVPQLLDKVVREYDQAGKILWEVKTPHWPFTAIRLSSGSTLVNCTYGNVALEYDQSGGELWRLGNDDLPSKPFHDACGGQRLANGNTVIASYGAKPGETRLFEVNPAKELIWTHTDDRPAGIHHFQILTTNGQPEPQFWR